MEKSNNPPQANNSNIKIRAQRLKSKLLSSYYGNPAKDMKVICITGTTGKVTVARLAQEILRAASLHSAVLASDAPIKSSTLHKFLNEAWKQNNNYVIITAPAASLSDNSFYGLPVHIAALTDFIPSSLSDFTVEEYLNAKSTLFDMQPEIVILNRDDAYYDQFSRFIGSSDTYTYGQHGDSSVRIDHSTLYKKGTEANLIFGNKAFTVASFLTGEPSISYMTAAATIATALHIAPVSISEGIANFDPES